MSRDTSRLTALIVLTFLSVGLEATAQEGGAGVDEQFLLLMGARNATKANKYTTAVERYTQFLEHNPQRGDVRTEFAWILLTAGHTSEAEGVFRRAITLAPTDTHAWEGLLETLRHTHKKDEILPILQQLVKLNPARRDLRVDLTLELHNRKLFGEAEKHLVILLGEK